MGRHCLLEALPVQLMSMKLSKVADLNGQSFIGVIIDGPYKAKYLTRSTTPLLLGDLSRFWRSFLGPLVYLLTKLLTIFGFPTFDSEST